MKGYVVHVKKWIFQHEIISSSIFALIMGLVIGGVATALEWLLV